MQDKCKDISLDKRGLIIDDQYTIILCASLFYFRIPAELWRDRMKKIRLAGYNCIDVYFPWNFHELDKGEWCFSGQRDVDRFLTIAGQEGLYVVARPGPYICSEWDGGSLPAYLFTEENMKIRDNDPEFLNYVAKWYDRILPIIARHQVINGGPVVMVQLENELDFYECEDRYGYMLNLKKMADKHGIEVPCIACAGQGDIYGAWGQAEGVIPTLNVYLNPSLPDMEAGLDYYVKRLADMNAPLMVTETGREHLMLRRLLSGGTKLLGPYNQVAGTNFGFTNSVNNWGEPLSFITTNYNFRSLVDSFGRFSEEVYEARLLSGFISSMGNSLAGAVKPEDNSWFEVKADGHLGYSKVPVLSLLQEEYPGFVVAVTNVDEKPVNAEIIRSGHKWPRITKMTVPSKKSRFVLFDFNLCEWGIPGKIVFSSAEPYYISDGSPKVIVFHAESDGEVQFSFSGEQGGKEYTFVFNSTRETREEIVLPNGEKIVLYGVASSRASMLAGVSEAGLEYLPDDYFEYKHKEGDFGIRWSRTEINGPVIRPDSQPVYTGDKAIYMEQAGLYRGYGWYEGKAELPFDRKPLGVLLHDAADVVSVYCNDKYLGTVTPAGSCVLVELDDSGDKNVYQFAIRTEIWGHSNFDDSRKPALRIKSLRGISGATLITGKKHLPMWKVKLGYRKQPYEIKTGFGGWLTTRKPVQCSYYATLHIPQDAERSLLYFEGIQCKGIVNVNGEYAGEVDVFNSYVDISSIVEPGSEIDVNITLEKRYHAEPAGRVYLLTGTAVSGWSLTGCAEEGLWQAADKIFSRENSDVNIPFETNPGSVTWLLGEIDPDTVHGCHVLKFTGRNAKLTVFFNGKIVGRIWLPSPNRPFMTGGVDNIAYLPGCWFKEKDNRIAVMVEAVVKDQPAVVETVESQNVEFSLL